MLSEHRIQQALEVLAAPRERFRSAVAAAVDQVGAFLEARRAPTNGRAERIAHELGAFAAGRLDPGRFASFFGESGTLDPLALARMERAHDTLRGVCEHSDDLFVTRVAPGADLRTQVRRALAEIGRAFGAARNVEMARQGRYPSDEHEEYIGGFAFRKWNRAERQIAPPLVVEVEGADLQAGGLAEFLDGAQKIVLVVRGPAPAAPLVRLITPGVFVMQTVDPADLKSFVTAEGPGIAALVSDSAARFVHTPGDAPVCERLTVHFVPEQEPRAALGSFTVFQQREEIASLREMARPPAPPSPSPSPAGGEGSELQTTQPAPGAGAVPLPPLVGGRPGGGGLDPADRLASFLLSESGLAPQNAAAAPAPAPAAPVAPAAVDPADKLAAWLLSQTDLTGT
jgi:hypothetical protein